MRYSNGFLVKQVNLLDMNKIILLAAITIVLFSCKKEDPDVVECGSLTPTYTNDVASLINQNCAISGCHGNGSSKGGVDLSGYSAVKAESSKKQFLGAIQHKSGYSKMPKNANKLSDADIKTITCWVQNGSPE